MGGRFAFEIFLCCLYAGLNVAGASTIKAALHGRSLNNIPDYISFLFYWKTILGLSFIFLSALVVFKALSIAKMTYILPISTGINFLMIFGIGILVFKESQTWQSYIGAAFVLFGILLMSIKTQQH
jgi:multidrug transporter EmrE-like cation transporter